MGDVCSRGYPLSACEYRIEKAAGLLLSTEKKAGEIATACGFSDISYFTRRFREINGCTPLEYRKENICF